MTEEFHRIRRLPPYVFAEVNAAKAKARAAAEDIVDLGMGNPDSPTPPHIVAKLVEAVQDPRTHRYSMSKGIPGPAVVPPELSGEQPMPARPPRPPALVAAPAVPWGEGASRPRPAERGRPAAPAAAAPALPEVPDEAPAPPPPELLGPPPRPRP